MEIRPKICLKPRIFQTTSTTEIIDFRKDEKINNDNEVRRMKREQIPLTPEAEHLDKIGSFWSTGPLPKRASDRLRALLLFFTTSRIEQMVIPIISVTSKISLRALDWLVINYSKKHKVVLVNTSSNIINVYDNYRAWLKFWKRSLFDAFRRGQRVYFEFHGFVYSTTVAQLNFLFWADRVGVLDYARHHIEELEQDMNQRIAECRKEKALVKEMGGKRKRSELSKAPLVKCMIFRVPCTIQFE